MSIKSPKKSQRKIRQSIVSLFRKGKKIPKEYEGLSREVLDHIFNGTPKKKSFIRTLEKRTKEKLKRHNVLSGKPQASGTVKISKKKAVAAAAKTPDGFKTPKKPNSAMRRIRFLVIWAKIKAKKVCGKLIKIKETYIKKVVLAKVPGEDPVIGNKLIVNRSKTGKDISAKVTVLLGKNSKENGNKFGGRKNRRSHYSTKKPRVTKKV